MFTGKLLSTPPILLYLTVQLFLPRRISFPCTTKILSNVQVRKQWKFSEVQTNRQIKDEQGKITLFVLVIIFGQTVRKSLINK
jgi:hypothetical protein